MPADSSAALQALVTKTATFNGAGLNIPTGTPKRGMVARFSFPTFLSATAGTVFTPTIDHSDDNTTFTTLVTGSALTGATAANTSTPPQFLRFSTKKPYVRASVTMASGGAPSMAYQVDLVPTEVLRS